MSKADHLEAYKAAWRLNPNNPPWFHCKVGNHDMQSPDGQCFRHNYSIGDPEPAELVQTVGDLIGVLEEIATGSLNREDMLSLASAALAKAKGEVVL